MGKTTGEFRVIACFDAITKDASDIHIEVSQLLASLSLVKNTEGYHLPHNIYIGIITKEFRVLGNKVTSREIQEQAKIISQKTFKLLEDYFLRKRCPCNIFVSSSLQAMNSLVITKNKLK